MITQASAHETETKCFHKVFETPAQGHSVFLWLSQPFPNILCVRP